MAIFRVNKNKNYTVMCNHHLKNRNLSLKAVGLLSVILSLPDEWVYSVAGLTKIVKDGTDSVESALKELKKEGYIKVTKLMPSQTKSGRIEYIYDIFEIPPKKQGGEKQPLEFQGVEFQGVEFQGVEFQGVENPPQLSIKEVSTKEVNKKEKSKECVSTNCNSEKLQKKSNCTKTENNTHTPSSSKSSIPTLTECEQYAKEKEYDLDVERFYNYYDALGWLVKGNPVTNWKALLTNWVKNQYPNHDTGNIGNKDKMMALATTGFETPEYDF